MRRDFKHDFSDKRRNHPARPSDRRTRSRSRREVGPRLLSSRNFTKAKPNPGKCQDSEPKAKGSAGDGGYGHAGSHRAACFRAITRSYTERGPHS